MGKTIIIRHSEDEQDDLIHRNDNQLTRKGKKLCRYKSKYLVEKYGEPDIIFCSPMYRTRQTLSYMKRNIKGNFDIVIDNRLSRYFGSSRRNHKASLFEQTKKYGVPLVENREQFNKRCDSFIRYILDNSEEFRDLNIWIITHTLVIDRFFKKTNKELGRVEFLQHYIISY